MQDPKKLKGAGQGRANPLSPLLYGKARACGMVGLRLLAPGLSVAGERGVAILQEAKVCLDQGHGQCPQDECRSVMCAQTTTNTIEQELGRRQQQPVAVPATGTVPPAQTVDGYEVQLPHIWANSMPPPPGIVGVPTPLAAGATQID